MILRSGPVGFAERKSLQPMLEKRETGLPVSRGLSDTCKPFGPASLVPATGPNNHGPGYAEEAFAGCDSGRTGKLRLAGRRNRHFARANAVGRRDWGHRTAPGAG